MESNGKHDNDPIRAHTSQAVQQKIDSSMEERIRFYATQPKEAISRRLEELSHEKDIDRTILTGAAGLALGGIVLSLLGGGRKYLLFSGGVVGCLLWHGSQGWCSAATALRRFGLRTRAEIDAERYALKLLRGDLESVNAEENQTKSYSAEQVWGAVRA